MRKVYLHGALGARFGESYDLEVRTAGEALRALAANFPDFQQAIADGAWHIVRGEIESGFSLDIEQVTGLGLGKGDLHILPAVAGSKNDGLLKTIVGVALIGAAFAFSGGALAAPIVMGGMQTGLTFGNLAMIGGALALAGVSTMLAPEEKDKKDRDSSFVFSGPSNNYTQGSPIPVVIGEVITGSLVVSGGLDVERIAVGA